jgi:lambda family phage portal protein
LSILKKLASFAHRAVNLALGPYRAGEITRLNKAWLPQSYSAEGAIREAWDLATRRIRDLASNDPTIIALKNALINGVIRTGIATMADVAVGDDLDDQWNDESDREFDDYAFDPKQFDVEGRLAWPDVQRQLFDQMLDTGQALLLRCQDDSPGRTIPLCYQVLEAEQLDVTMDRPAREGQNEIVRGVELGRLRRPVAYWLFDSHPADPHGWSTKSTRVPAERVIDVLAPGRPGRARGMGLHASIVQTARDLDNYLGSELTAAIIASLFTVVHKTQNPGSGMGFVGDGTEIADGTDRFGNPRVKLGRGIVSQIGLNEDIKTVASNRPNSQADTFVRLMLMLIGMGGGVSRYRLTRDYTGTTYVAGRCARLDDADAFEPLQGYFGRSVCIPVRVQWTDQMAAYGRFESLSAPQFRTQRRRWLSMQLLFPGVDQIDKEKETDADLAALGAHTTTYQRIYARQGLSYRRELRQAAREQRWIRDELELEPSYLRPSTPPGRASDQNAIAGGGPEQGSPSAPPPATEED